MRIFVLALLAVGVWLIPGSAAAQGNAANFGVQAGGGLAYLTVPEDVAREMGLGSQVGIFGALPVWRNIYFRPELVYERRKSKVDGREYSSEYIAVPLMVHFEIGGLYLAEGLSFKKPRSVEIDGVDVTDNAKNDISLLVVAGLRVGVLGAELRWDQGFRRLQKELGPGEFAVRHRSLSLHGVLSFGGSAE